MTKKIFILVLGIGIIMSACAPSRTLTPVPNISTAIATQAPPTATITPTSSPTPIPTPPIISASNVMNLQEDFRIGQGGVTDAVWMPDGNVALVHSTGVSIYDPVTGNLISSVESPITKSIYSIMSPDGKHVAALMYEDNKVIVWDANTGKIEHELETGCQARSFSYQMIAFSSDGSKLATCDEQGVSLWDLIKRRKDKHFQDGTQRSFFHCV